ncbi:MAG TPA: alpha/beta hydrolase-fold protein [Polyangiaceae bacterium]|nr:alpha/beta hydrolase-fold protein [Polyangiaceae bacterium]
MTRFSTPDAPHAGKLTAPTDAARRGLLAARPGTLRLPAAGAASLSGGRIPLGVGRSRDGFLQVPKAAAGKGHLPLLVFFHGAGGNADQAGMVLALAEEHGALLLAIDSRGGTWDVIEGEVGPDVAFLDEALRWTFARFEVAPDKLAVSGFSDGASYALSLGLANGELFSSVLAFSPGFAAPTEVHGEPRVFISHGVHDGVLPIHACSRRLVPRLRSAGYAVEYREFDGGHAVPADIARAAFGWLTSS